MSLTASEVHKLKKAPPVEGVLPIFHQRWSARSFNEREVSPEALRMVFEAARWAASSSNEQPWRFLVGRRGTETFKKIYESLGGFNRDWAGRAPVLILGVAHTRFSKNATENHYALFDLGAATSYLTLQAAELGMTTHQMAGYDHDAARQALGIPEEYALGSVIALGYQGEPAALGNATLIERETSARTRKPLDEIVFSEWGKTAEI
ncbi:MAG: nitroreductase family protein [Terracidiphilus sp.]|jgi:nitroreductase